MMSPMRDLMSCLAFFVPYLVITAGSPKLQTKLLRVGISDNDSSNGPDEISARSPVPAPPDGKESGVRQWQAVLGAKSKHCSACQWLLNPALPAFKTIVGYPAPMLSVIVCCQFSIPSSSGTQSTCYTAPRIGKKRDHRYRYIRWTTPIKNANTIIAR
ncbi:uncharacterized protein BDZ83DRAFT_648496 [Colletotrichum acutatum]|uniref:Secreted protein n=1 Tax=Glomerella acutata TaxID=27357 RepID=A0AAD8XHS9_GLOAC|nr:uncharacterized protein BDZ83DRAFT_648496 [Colletotrichum acutatum]KAK1728534.1 hypothetical protein BDZ83DRAFT_648496 [Colletotrichum acutatum]